MGQSQTGEAYCITLDGNTGLVTGGSSTLLQKNR